MLLPCRRLGGAASHRTWREADHSGAVAIAIQLLNPPKLRVKTKNMVGSMIAALFIFILH